MSKLSPKRTMRSAGRPCFARMAPASAATDYMLLHALRAAAESGDTASALTLYTQLTGLTNRPSLDHISNWVSRQCALGGDALRS